MGGGIKRRFCLTTSVWHLSVAYIGPKSRTERPRKTKIGTEIAHVTRDSDITFKVKRSKVKVTRPLYSARPLRVRQLQRSAWERIRRGETTARLRCAGRRDRPKATTQLRTILCYTSEKLVLIGVCLMGRKTIPPWREHLRLGWRGYSCWYQLCIRWFVLLPEQQWVVRISAVIISRQIICKVVGDYCFH